MDERQSGELMQCLDVHGLLRSGDGVVRMGRVQVGCEIWDMMYLHANNCKMRKASLQKMKRSSPEFAAAKA